MINCLGCGQSRSDHFNSQSNTQNGFTITVPEVKAGPDGVQLFVELENQSNETVYFYDVNTEIWHGDKRYEPKRMFGLANELPSKINPDTEAEGLILFPSFPTEEKEAVIRFQRSSSESQTQKWDLVEFRWPLPFPSTLDPAETTSSRMRPKKVSRKIAIIKADDLREPATNWERFLEVSRKRNIKVSIGIVCESLESEETGNFDWIRNQHQSGQVEFWCHGWDHQRLGQGRLSSEFNGSGYEYQKRHITDSQEWFERRIGVPFTALGTPWNEFDYETVRVINEDPHLRLLFGHKKGILKPGNVVVRMFPAEADGTGKPNFKQFKSLYDSQKMHLDVIALQFHPLGFDEHGFREYERTLDFLLEEGWKFMLPRDYLDQWDKQLATKNADHDGRR